jgi:hypothetical protein
MLVYELYQRLDGQDRQNHYIFNETLVGIYAVATFLKLECCHISTMGRQKKGASKGKKCFTNWPISLKLFIQL